MVPSQNSRPYQPEQATMPKLLAENPLSESSAPPQSSRHLRFLLPILQRMMKSLPAGLPMWIYTILLSPTPLRRVVNSLLLKVIPQQVDIGGVLVMLNPNDPVVSSALSLGIYEQYETALITELVQPGMKVLDIGANVGYYTALLARQVGPTGSVMAFEPEPGNYNILCRTVEANNFAHVHTMRGAVASATGESLLYLSLQNQGDHRLYATKGRGSISVPIISIDSYLSEESTLDFVKMDIQGSEGLALRGMRESLRRSPNVQILTEFWPEGLMQAGTDPLTFLEMLSELEFRLWEVDEQRETLVPVSDFAALIARNPGRSYTNLLCSRRGGLECAMD